MGSTIYLHDMDTRVTEDGDILRSTQLIHLTIIDGKITNRELKNKQINRYDKDEPIPSDYIRKTEQTDDTSRNHINVHMLNAGVFKLFTYEESFHDVTDKEKFLDSAYKAYHIWHSVLSHSIYKSLQEEYPREVIRRAVTYVYEPLIEEFIREFRKPGNREHRNSETLDLMFDYDWISEHIALKLRPIPYNSYKRFKQSLRSAFNMPFNDAASYFEIFLTERDMLNIFGVEGYSFCIFDCVSYSFSVSLRLPGQLIRHNGQLLDDGRIQWEFKDEDFTYEPHILMAQSILFYPHRIFITILVIISALAIFVFTWKLRRRMNYV